MPIRPLISAQAVIDYMHCVCLGVVAKTLLSKWLDQSHHSEPFSIRRKLHV